MDYVYYMSRFDLLGNSFSAIRRVAFPGAGGPEQLVRPSTFHVRPTVLPLSMLLFFSLPLYSVYLSYFILALPVYSSVTDNTHARVPHFTYAAILNEICMLIIFAR